MPDRFVTESPKSVHGKGILRCLELLETHYVRFSFANEAEVVEPLIDVVNVEGGDFHQVPFRPPVSGCSQQAIEFVLFRPTLLYRDWGTSRLSPRFSSPLSRCRLDHIQVVAVNQKKSPKKQPFFG